MNIFYLLSILFIITEIYNLKNINRLYMKSKDIDTEINKITKTRIISDIFFHMFKLLYMVWIFIGLFTGLNIFFWILFSFGIGKYITIFFPGWSKIYDICNSSASILVLTGILYYFFI